MHLQYPHRHPQKTSMQKGYLKKKRQMQCRQKYIHQSNHLQPQHHIHKQKIILTMITNSDSPCSVISNRRYYIFIGTINLPPSIIGIMPSPCINSARPNIITNKTQSQCFPKCINKITKKTFCNLFCMHQIGSKLQNKNQTFFAKKITNNPIPPCYVIFPSSKIISR